VPARMTKHSDPRPRLGRRARSSLRAFTIATAVAAPLLVAGCGGGDDCSGLITVNTSPAECEALAARFGCGRFTVDGPSCGLFACASCGDLNEPTPTPTAPDSAVMGMQLGAVVGR